MVKTKAALGLLSLQRHAPVGARHATLKEARNGQLKPSRGAVLGRFSVAGQTQSLLGESQSQQLDGLDKQLLFLCPSLRHAVLQRAGGQGSQVQPIEHTG